MVQMIRFTNTNTPNGLAKVSIHRLKKKKKKSKCNQRFIAHSAGSNTQHS